VAKRRSRRKRSPARFTAIVLAAAVAAGAAWGLWQIAESRREGRSVPTEDIRPSERGQLDAVLQDLDKGDSNGRADH
jgi:hypothetical protein